MIPIDPKLKLRVDNVLAKLATLSEVPASRMTKAPTAPIRTVMEPGGTWGYGGSTSRAVEGGPPRGFDWALGDRPPDPDRDSLLHWFLWRLERAGSEPEVKAATAEAEVRYDRRVHRQHTRPVAFAGNADTTKLRNERIAAGYTGLSPEEVAVIESESYGWCPPANVRLERVRAERDPESGEREPVERRLRGRERERRAVELVESGLSEREAARLFGVARSTLQGWLAKHNARRAA